MKICWDVLEELEYNGTVWKKGPTQYHYREGCFVCGDPFLSQKKINHFKKYGFDTLVIWEHELSEYGAVVHKLMEFHNS